MYTVYKQPLDYPHSWVIRRSCVVEGNPEPVHDQDITLEVKTYEEILDWVVPRGLTRLDRHPTDEPQIVETWI